MNVEPDGLYVDAPKSLSELISDLPPGRLAELLRRPDIKDRGYLHWDKLRHLDPPPGVTHTEWWTVVRLRRGSEVRSLPLIGTHGDTATFSTTDEIARLLHFTDRHCSGSIAMPAPVLSDENARSHYLMSSLMEEAIRSSQIEGAATTRQVAKELLRTGRDPKSRDERMVVNNYRAMQYIDDLVDRNIEVTDVIELQRILTEGTLDDPNDAGRIQQPGEERVVVGTKTDGSVIHRPPAADELPQRLEAMCTFANDRNSAATFVHPVIRAIVLHFWLAYDHPFVDGNGRTARALFYWKMRNEGYWLAEYLSISQVIRRSIAKYVKAFLRAETDELDLTYFLIHQLQVIEAATGEFFKYVERKVAETNRLEQSLRPRDFNYRQRALLSAALRNPQASFSFRSHAMSHNVTHETARRDITALEQVGLLERHRDGRNFVFVAVGALSDKLKSIAASPPSSDSIS